MRMLLQILLVFGLLVSGNIFASDKYRVSLQVFSLGELVAQPVMVVEEDQTSSGSYSMPGEAQYKFVVLIRPASDDQVWVSMQFSSGKIDLQPNLLVDLNKQTAVTIDKTRLNLLVQKEPDSMSGNHALTGTFWWVEDIAGKGVVDMSHTTIEFTDDGRVVGDTGCNRYSGGVEITENSIAFGALAGTRKMCAPALMDQEQAFFQSMTRVSKWEVAETGLLHLRDIDGAGQFRASKVEQ